MANTYDRIIIKAYYNYSVVYSSSININVDATDVTAIKNEFNLLVDAVLNNVVKDCSSDTYNIARLQIDFILLNSADDTSFACAGFIDNKIRIWPIGKDYFNKIRFIQGFELELKQVIIDIGESFEEYNCYSDYSSVQKYSDEEIDSIFKNLFGE